MTWFGVLLIVYWVLNGLIAITWTNRSFTYTPTVVVTVCAVYVFLIWGAVTVGTLR